MAAAALVLASCSKDENGIDEIQNGEIRLTSGVAVQTRAFGIDQQINNGQTVAVYVDKTTDGTPLYGNNVLTANGSGGFADGTIMYFPEDKGNVSIYALATNGTLSDAFPTAAVTHTVAADQKLKADYSASDLLYSTNTNVAFTKNAIALTFYHLLSKVEVALVSGNGTPNLTGATVKIIDTKLKADFMPNKTATMATQSERAAMITATDADNEAAAITIGNVASTDFTTGAVYNEAVIVPQVIAEAAKFIEVTLSTGAVLSYKLASATTFESGKKYQYQITVNLTDLTVTSTISNWTPVGAVSGDAEMD